MEQLASACLRRREQRQTQHFIVFLLGVLVLRLAGVFLCTNSVTERPLPHSFPKTEVPHCCFLSSGQEAASEIGSVLTFGEFYWQPCLERRADGRDGDNGFSQRSSPSLRLRVCAPPVVRVSLRPVTARERRGLSGVRRDWTRGTS